MEKKLSITDEQINKLEICFNEHGKPHFNSFDVRFSVSHSGRFWGCLMGFDECGFDMEDMLNRKIHNYEALAKRFFNQNEYRYVLKNGLTGFMDIWIRKEAYIKYLGVGLSYGLNNFSVLDACGTLKNTVNEANFKEINLEQVDNFKRVKAVYYCKKENILGKVKVIEE